MKQIITALALLTTLLIATDAYAQGSDSLKRGKALVQEGRYVEALDLLEPIFESRMMRQGGWEWNRGPAESRLSIESMKELYRRAGREERGALLFKRIYDAVREHDERAAGNLEGHVIDLALAARKLDVALEVAERGNARENYPGWDLTFARIYAASGKSQDALAKLRSYLAYEVSDSPARILIYPELAALYGDRSFRDMLIAQIDTMKRRAQRYSREMPRKESPTHSLDEVLKAAATYAQVKDEESGRALQESLVAADEVVGPNVEVYRKELLEALRTEKNSYYRVTVGRMLLAVNDTALLESVAEIVAGNDFRAYPKQLFYLTYMIARVDPAAARPLMMQMLGLSKGSVFVPAHFMTLNWDQLLLQTFGVAEPASIDVLVQAAEGDDSIASRNASRLLGVLQEPRLVSVLMKRIERATTPGERRRLIDLLSSLYLPETIDALKALEARGGSSSEMLALRVSLKAMKAPSGEIFPDKEGIAITDPAIKALFFRALEETHGVDVSFLEKTIALTATGADIPQLQRIRSSILFRVSDEALDDWQSMTAIIARARWRGGGR